jgi:hypothetical protein
MTYQEMKIYLKNIKHLDIDRAEEMLLYLHLSSDRSALPYDITLDFKQP